MGVSVQVWLAGIRPRTLVAGAAPVVVGSALAWGAPGFRPLAVLLALAGALALQAAANLVNDVGDGQAGIDGVSRVGPRRLVQDGLATPRQVWVAAGIALAIGALAGLGLIAIAGWPILAIGLTASAAAVGYTVGPAPLARLGLGEVAAFCFFGPVAVLGTVYAATGRWHDLPVLWSLPTGLLAAALMLANNLRDRESDAVSGKRTLAVRLGDRAARGLYRALIATAVAVPLVAAVTGQRPAVALAAGVMLPWALRSWDAVRPDRSGRALAPALGCMGDLLAIAAVALTAVLAAPPPW